MKIIGIACIRNESKNWYYERFLYQMNYLCDDIILIDDNSIDDSHLIAKNYTNYITKNLTSQWETNESILRNTLMSKAYKIANTGDIIICFDVDEILDYQELMDLKHFLTYQIFEKNMFIGFRLFDMWDMENYRDDEFWKAHYSNYWKFGYVVDKGVKFDLIDNKLHCGRWWKFDNVKICLTKFKILHYGWSTPELRQKKYDRYMKIDPKGEFGILEQYKSILDKKPNLKNIKTFK